MAPTLRGRSLVSGLAVLVLTIACSNLAGVQLARALGRGHEFAIRSALGARRFALMVPLLTESMPLTVAGGGFGLLLADWTNHLVSHYFAGGISIDIDHRVLFFTAMAALLTALTFGFAPAWLASRVSTSDALKDGSRASTSGRMQRWLKSILIAGQLAFAFVLISAALSFALGVRGFMKRDLGWRPSGLVSGILNVPWGVVNADGKNPALVHELQAKLAAIPGVTRLSMASQGPLYGYPGQENFLVEGEAPPPSGR
ncbi:MAG: FtsX-like permease family protein [Opitutaceae bacterium]